MIIDKQTMRAAIRLLRLGFWYRTSMDLARLSAWCMKQRAKACGCALCEAVLDITNPDYLVRVAYSVRSHAEDEMAKSGQYPDGMTPVERIPS